MFLFRCVLYGVALQTIFICILLDNIDHFQHENRKSVLCLLLVRKKIQTNINIYLTLKQTYLSYFDEHVCVINVMDVLQFNG